MAFKESTAFEIIIHQNVSGILSRLLCLCSMHLPFNKNNKSAQLIVFT